MKNLLNKLIEREDLTSAEAEGFLRGVVNGDVSPVITGAVLIALRMKGESVSEITGLIREMRKNMVRVNLEGAVDVCGTGGDGQGTFNISTATGFVAAGAGAKVVKHGNRAASSKCGSADVLERLGVKIELSARQAEKVFAKTGMVFLFAPVFHPAMKQVALVRKELGVRTIFNYLGPFANPASVERQIIGVPNIEIAEKLAAVGKELGYKQLLVVSSEEGLDEISISSNSVIFEVREGTVDKRLIDPRDYGFDKVSPDKIKGGDTDHNAEIIIEILEGKRGARRDVVVLNSGFALYVSGLADDVRDGILMAEKSIDSGKARGVLEDLVRETKSYE